MAEGFVGLDVHNNCWVLSDLHALLEILMLLVRRYVPTTNANHHDRKRFALLLDLGDCCISRHCEWSSAVVAFGVGSYLGQAHLQAALYEQLGLQLRQLCDQPIADGSMKGSHG